MSWTAALSAAGSFLSGASGFLGGGGTSNKRMESAAKIQYEWQRRLNQTAIQDRVEDAEKAGIHPLFALGASVQQGGISMPSYSDSDRFANMGQNIERAVSAFDTYKQRKMMEKSTLLDIERKQIENETLRNQAIGSRMALQKQAGQPPSNQSVVKQDLERMTTPIGSQDGVLPVHQIGYDEDGKPVQFFNTNELGDNELAQGAHFLMYTAPQWLWNHTGGRYLSDKLRKQFQKNKILRQQNKRAMERR